MKVLYFDTETTGTDPIEHDIIQLSGLIEIDGKLVDNFNLMMQPLNYDNIQPEAIETHGITVDMLKTYPKPEATYEMFVKMLDTYIDKYDRNDKFYPAGYNVRFDLDFLQSYFVKMGNKYGIGSYQNWRAIDGLPIVHFLDFAGMLKLDNYKLETVCKNFDIKITAHDALSDIVASRELIKVLLSIIAGGEATAPINEGGLYA